MNGVQENSSANQLEENEIEIPVPYGFIRCIAYGDKNGIPMLAVHGWMNNACTFEKIIPLLDKKFYIVSIDLPGHGLSDHLPMGCPYEYTDYVLAIRRTRDFFKWEKFYFLGHSLGAGLGSYYASIFPDQIERLVMLDLTKPMAPALKDNDKYKNYGEKVAAAIENFLTAEEFTKENPTIYTYKDALKRLLQGTNSQFDEESGKILLKRGLKRVSNSGSENDDKWIYTRDIRACSAIINRASQEQMFQILENLTCPLLILKAKDSSYFEPQENCEKAMDLYRKNSKKFEFIIVEGNHYFHLESKAAAIIASEANKFLLKDI